MKVRVVLASLFLLLIIISSPSVVCEARDEDPNIEITVVVRNVEKVDLSESTFKIDFYLVLNVDTSEVSLEDAKQFEFVNGEPSIRISDETYYSESHTEIVYRVKGDFITPFELGMYPFDRHNIEIMIEFPFATSEITLEPFSIVAEDMIIVGWDFEGIESRVIEYSYDGGGAHSSPIHQWHQDTASAALNYPEECPPHYNHSSDGSADFPDLS